METSGTQEIQELLDAWRDAMRRGDADALASLVTEDAEFWTHGIAPLVGRQALRDALTPVFIGYEAEQEFDLQELVVSGNFAFMRGMERNTMKAKDGSQLLERRQRAFSIMRRDSDGKWRFARGMTNLPPEE